MDEWIQAQLAAGLPALRGTAVSGTLALSEDLLNELVKQWLAAQREAPAGASPSFPVHALLPFLEHAEVRAHPGAVLIDFQVRV
jgi:hypothetical protein